MNAEREIAFRSVEVTASVIVLAGIILGAAAVVGASIASAGALPIALIITGIFIGLGMKVFQAIDKKANHKYSDPIISGIKRFYNGLFSKSPQTTPEPNHEEKVQKHASLVSNRSKPNTAQIEDT